MRAYAAGYARLPNFLEPSVIPTCTLHILEIRLFVAW
jgi:hypothetical protein